MKKTIPFSLIYIYFALWISTGIFRNAEHIRTELLNKTFTSFHVIEWIENRGCRNLATNAHSFKNLRRTVTWGTDPLSTTTCLSKKFFPKNPYLELEFAGYSRAAERESTFIAVESGSGREIKRLHPGEDQNSGVWKLAPVILENEDLKDGIRIRIIDLAQTDGWIALRDRVNEYKTNLIFHKLRGFIRHSLPQETFKVLSIVSLSFLLLYLLNARRSQQVLFLYLLPIAWHFNTRTYFFGDDFMYFEEFSKDWSKSIFYRHNEHILPVFSSIFRLQFSIFGDHYRAYSFISILLLSTLCHTLLCVFEELSKRLQLNKKLAFLLCTLFLLSGLHTETVQWLTCQSTLLSLQLRLFCYYFTLLYFRTGERKLIILAAASAMLCPLSFAGGFTIPIEIALLTYALPPPKGHRKNSTRLYCIGSIALATALAAIPYVLLMNSSGTGLRIAQASAPSATSVVRYIAFGGYFGTVIRGVGLLPIVSISEAYRLFPQIVSIVGSFDLFGSALGIAITLGFYLRVAKRLRARSLSKMFFFAQVLTILPFIISSFGRTRFGVDYSLQLRFHSVSLLGLCLSVFCICSCLNFPDVSKRVKQFITLLLISGNLYAQHTIIGSMTFFTKRGPYMRSFVEQIKHWESKLPEATQENSTDPFATGAGTPLAGLYPVHYGGNPIAPSAKLSRPSREKISQIFGYKSRHLRQTE